MITLKDVREALRELAHKLEVETPTLQELRSPLMQAINDLQEIEAQEVAVPEAVSNETYEICYCELTGHFLVVSDKTCCGLCDTKDRKPFTVDSVQATFKWIGDNMINARPDDARPGDFHG